jgi:23S rRNA pseudouridine2605 synthase
MTNDGELANVLTSAASQVQKTYLVKVSGKPTEDALQQLRQGVMIERGRRGEREGRVMTQPAKISLVRDTGNPWFEVVLTEGKNREIRKMFEEVGHFVEKVRRVGFGPLVLDVPPGEMRELQEEEVVQLKRAARRRAVASGGPAAQPRKPVATWPRLRRWARILTRHRWRKSLAEAAWWRSSSRANIRLSLSKSRC